MQLQQIPDYQGFLGGANGKEATCQCRRHRTCGFHPCVGKIPWRGEWQPTSVFLPGESHGWGVWWATVHGLMKSWTRLSNFHFSHFFGLMKNRRNKKKKKKETENLQDLQARKISFWLNYGMINSWAQKSLWTVTTTTKLKDTCSLEEKLWQT